MLQIKWDNVNINIDGFKIYRSTTPIDQSNLPQPIATVDSTTLSYIDYGAGDGDYYRVAAYKGQNYVLSDEFQVNLGGLGYAHFGKVTGIWDNINSGVPNLTEYQNNLITIDHLGNNENTNWFTEVPASGNFTRIFRIKFDIHDSTYIFAGVFASTGLHVDEWARSVGYLFNNRLAKQWWRNHTSFSSENEVIPNVGFPTTNEVEYWKIRRVGTDILYYRSTDGLSWGLPVVTEPESQYLAPVNRVGIMLNTHYVASGVSNVMILEGFDVSDQPEAASYSAGTIIPATKPTFEITIPASIINSDIANYAIPINMSEMPQEWWNNVNIDGGNIRVFDMDDNQLPCDVVFIDEPDGLMYVRYHLSSTTDTKFKIVIEDLSTTAVPETDPYGMHATHSGAEVVIAFPNPVNRTGKTYQIDMSNLRPDYDWKRSGYHDFANNPHQGIAIDINNSNIITINTNRLTLYSLNNLSNVMVDILDPLGSSGIAGINHLGDGCVLNNELFVVAEIYPNNPYNNQHVLVFDSQTLSFKRSHDISVNAHEVSGICWTGSEFLITDYITTTLIHRYSFDFQYLGTIQLSTPISNMQGITKVGPVFYVSSNTNGNPIYSVELNGFVQGKVFERATSGINEGIDYIESSDTLYILDGDGDMVIADRKYAGWRSLHNDTASIVVDPLSDVFTASVSVVWQSYKIQQGFLSYANGSSNNYRTTMAYHNNTDKIALWNSNDSWADGLTDLNTYTDYRLSFSHNANIDRKLWVNGNIELTDGPVSNKPSAPTGTTSAELVLNGSETNQEVGFGLYQCLTLRHEIMSDDWHKVEYMSIHQPNLFYSVNQI